MRESDLEGRAVAERSFAGVVACSAKRVVVRAAFRAIAEPPVIYSLH